MDKVNKKALSYVRSMYKGRNIRICEYDQDTLEMESGKDFHGKTYWSEVACIAQDNHGHFLVDKTGDYDRVICNL